MFRAVKMKWWQRYPRSLAFQRLGIASVLASLERRLRSSDDPDDRDTWTTNLRTLHTMFDAKRAAATMQLITAESGDPKRLWRSLSATLCLAEPDPVIPHTVMVCPNDQ